MNPKFSRYFAIITVVVCCAGCSGEHVAAQESRPPNQSPNVPKPRPNEVPTKPSREEAIKFLASLSSRSTGAIGELTNPDAIAMGVKPTLDTIYNLHYMKAVQKVPEGYFLQWAPYGEIEAGDPIFLRTDLNLKEGALISAAGYWAVYTGPFHFQNSRGFERSIYGFELLTPEPASYPRDINSVDLEVLYGVMRRKQAKPAEVPKLDSTLNYTPIAIYEYLVEVGRSQSKRSPFHLERKHTDALSRLKVEDLTSRGYSAWRAEEICADLSRGNFEPISQILGFVVQVAPLESKRPNKAPEPTPGAVTPRATEGDSK